MTKVLSFQILIVLLGTVALAAIGTRQQFLSFAAGSFLVTGNFILLGFGWNLVFRKKLIALAVPIIVFKYAILGIIIYLIARQSWLLPLWFVWGVTTITFGSLIYGLTQGLLQGGSEDEAESFDQDVTKDLTKKE